MTLTTALIIRRHINGLKPKQIFSIRDLLPYGSRRAVDLTMHKLVKDEVVYRVARGLYVRSYDTTRPPSSDDISSKKARAFAKETSTQGKQLAKEFHLASENSDNQNKLIYATTGSTSQFEYAGRTIKFQKQAPRKLILSNTRVGQFIQALWSLGPNYCYRRRSGPTIDFKQLIESRFNPIEQEELRMAKKWMPGWLSERLFAHQQVYFPKFQPRNPDHPANEDTLTDLYGLENWGWTFSNRN